MDELSDYDYALPAELIAQSPLANRSDARLLVVERRTGDLRHLHVRDLPEITRAGDCLVINETRVTPARLVGKRTMTGGKWEGLFISADERGNWRLLGSCRGKLRPGERVTLLDRDAREGAELLMLGREEHGVWLARPDPPEAAFDLLSRVGRVPLPRYIRGGQMGMDDFERYQTVYARRPGAVAAPTAGLHFTEELLTRLLEHGVNVARLTLHIGLDTFRPIKTARLADHPMHSETGAIDETAVATIAACRARGGRVIAIGTTTTRALETAASGGELAPWSGATSLFIRPPFRFRAIDGLFTNFHLPRSTLLVLVSEFGGAEFIKRAYTEAIREQYRFFSYGDAMLIV